MTGIENMNFPAFMRAEKQLTEAGYECVNPANHGSPGPDDTRTWADFMRVDITDMLTCDGLALLDGWPSSRGAKLEVYIADQLDIPAKFLEDWLKS